MKAIFRRVGLPGWLLRLVARARRPRRRQAAALCWRPAPTGAAGIEILLITTRRTGRWTPPKGGVKQAETTAEAALREAWEEAGVRGVEAATSLGAYTYLKFRKDGRWEHMAVDVHAIQVERMEDDHPEAGERSLLWAAQADAARMVRERSLGRIIHAFSPDETAPRCDGENAAIGWREPTG